MSLMKTLTKVAIGIAVAKGVQHVAGRAGAARADDGGLSGSLGGTRAGTGRSVGAGRAHVPDASSMGGIMEEILGAGKSTARRGATTGSQTGGIGDLLGSLAGGQTVPRGRSAAPSGGIGDLLTQALGQGRSVGAGAQGGGLGDLLGAVLGGAAGAGAAGGGLGQVLGGLLGGAPDGSPEAAARAEAETEAEAAILLRAMIMAVKADGQLDPQEKARLTEAAGDATRAEVEFINHELAAPVDLDGLLGDVPRGMEEKVYLTSLMAIDLDQRVEAEYLHRLAQGLGLSEAEVNALHDHMRAPRLYA